MNPLLDSQYLLHVMADLVRNHVRLRELAWRAETVLQLIEEAEVEVHFFVDRTVERTRSRLCRAARRIERVAEEHEFGVTIGPALFRQDLIPGVLHVVENERDELDGRRFGLVARAVRRADGLGRWGKECEEVLSE